MNTIKYEFRCHYPQLVYVEHRYLDNAQIGVSFIHVHDGRVFGGVRVFNMKDGDVQWKSPVNTYMSWADVYQRERE